MRAKTLKELAQALDLSITTVSRALAGHEQIALKTRHRVADAARRYGYVPNRAARQLVSGRSDFVGLVLAIRGPNFIDSYVGEIVTGLGEGLVAHGIDLFIATAQVEQSELSVLKHVVESGRADGVIITRVGETDERIAYLTERDFPFVAHGRLHGAERTHAWLDSDGETAFFELFGMLYDLGHRHFGLVSISDPMTFRHVRESGLRNAIARKGDPDVRLEIVNFPRFDRGASVAAVNRLLAAKERPTVIIGLFDEIALTVLEEAARAGLSVPRDLSVVGFDNISAAAYAPPGLTTFEAFTRQSAREMADMLVQIIDERPDIPLQRLIKPTLVARSSHGPAPGVHP